MDIREIACEDHGRRKAGEVIVFLLTYYSTLNTLRRLATLFLNGCNVRLSATFLAVAALDGGPSGRALGPCGSGQDRLARFCEDGNGIY